MSGKPGKSGMKTEAKVINALCVIENISDALEEARKKLTRKNYMEASSYLQDVRDDAERLQKWVEEQL